MYIKIIKQFSYKFNFPSVLQLVGQRVGFQNRWQVGVILGMDIFHHTPPTTTTALSVDVADWLCILAIHDAVGARWK